MELQVLKARLAPLDPIYLDAEPGEKTRILERSARAVCAVGPGGTHYQTLAADHIEQLFAAARRPDAQPPMRVWVDVPHGALATDGLDRALANLAEFLGDGTRSTITFHFPHDPRDWGATRRVVGRMRPLLKTPLHAGVELCAPFEEFRADDFEALFDLGVRLRFAAGWTAGCAADECRHVDAAVLRQFSEFGFRSVIEWYVHCNNAARFEEVLPDLLLANYASGFSLPLVSANPYYRFAPGFPSLPAAADYCQLLVRTYRQYPYFDDVFFPLTGLALLMREGGWQAAMGLPTHVGLVVREDGGVGVYRQSPALALPWTDVASLAAATKDRLREDFAGFARDAWRWERNAYCGGCRWRHLCGGLDAFAPGDAREVDLDCMCGYRKLFLEHFARARHPDSEVEAGPDGG
jgi:hypothetical protein